ncbi:MAG: chorismate synthase [Butyrivibrio sp.]|nr:chorismate synthase [Butyrivibrio sp.]
MAGSSFGNNLTVTTFGESHGPALGVVLDGFPAGMELDTSDIQSYLDRRKPGTSSVTTPRKEADEVTVLSGIFDGRTTGTPISMLVKNTSHISADYSEISTYYRPGHADLCFDEKYGFRDYRGGGRSSGRETIGRVAAGAVCQKLLKKMNIDVFAYVKSIGEVEINYENFDRSAITDTVTSMPDRDADKKAVALIESLKEEKDSIGGVVECRITGLPIGVGEPVFDKLDALLSRSLMSIGAVKAVEIGDGIKVSKMKGSENNDALEIKDGEIAKKTNHAGGITGGMSDGGEIVVRAYFKPTPSIAKTQETINKDGENITVNIKGRHDPVIVPRAAVVAECMCAITVLDLMMTNMHSKSSDIIDFYKA